jgi:hypothetical protein
VRPERTLLSAPLRPPARVDEEVMLVAFEKGVENSRPPGEATEAAGTSAARFQIRLAIPRIGDEKLGSVLLATTREPGPGQTQDKE